MSLKTILGAVALTSAAVTAIALPAVAQGVSPGVVQLSNQLGVVPGSLSLNELSQLANAKRENDAEAIRHITRGSGLSKSTMNVGGSSSPAAAQLEAALRVAPGQYSLTELTRLRQAQIDGDRETAQYILSGANRAATEATSTNAGKAQIAAQLGVNPADYSLAQLVAMLPKSDS